MKISLITCWIDAGMYDSRLIRVHKMVKTIVDCILYFDFKINTKVK